MILILMITLSSCTGVQQNTDFEKNVELAKTWFDTFTSEDYDATAALMSEDVEWQGCFYGSPVMNKEEAMAYMKAWHDAMENITYTPENYLPGVDPETSLPNGSVRTYGYWSATHSVSGKSFRGLWYHYLTFDENGKITQGGDFGDATGLVMSVMPDEE